MEETLKPLPMLAFPWMRCLEASPGHSRNHGWTDCHLGGEGHNLIRNQKHQWTKRIKHVLHPSMVANLATSISIEVLPLMLSADAMAWLISRMNSLAAGTAKESKIHFP